ncbi:MAG: signal transduction histidine kinase [Myxococcota bacterium]|jgi:signal transduction histidine kinase
MTGAIAWGNDRIEPHVSPWYVPSLMPILALATGLAGLTLWLDRRRWPLAIHCASVAAWAAATLLAARPDTRELGTRLMMVGFFIPASFLHVAARELSWRTPLVPAVYALGLGMTAAGLAESGLFLVDGGTAPGRFFAPMFLSSLTVGAIPIVLLLRDQAHGGPLAERRRYLLMAGAATTAGGGLNVVLLLTGRHYPIGLYLVLSSLGLLTYVAQAARLPAFGRFVERSQRYTLLAALLSTVWMFLLMSVVQAMGGSGWTWEAALLLFVLTLTVQPLLTEARSSLAGIVFPGVSTAEGLTRQLAESEARVEHAERLAELGTLASAVAHEVRNPLGVITACVTVLERQGADAETVDEIRHQVERAAHFADELLAYGRPSPLRLREVELADAVAMAVSEVSRSVPADIEVKVNGQALVQADLSQLLRLIGTLLENAALAGATAAEVQVRPTAGGATVCVDDDGPGVRPELRERLFDPFVTGRGRSGPRPGTGLGLAIARGIARRHNGDVRYAGTSPAGGARFEVDLPSDPEAPWR